jgi:protein-S-isoprenylcysteine O-methyltransferase Ste14
MGSTTPTEAPRSSNESDAAPPGTILAPSPILTLVAFLLGIGIEQIWASTLLLSWTWTLVVGLPLVVGGSLLFGSAIRTMRAHDKHPSHSDAPPEVIRAGSYQYSRNPIYVGHSLVHVGASVLVNSVWPLVTLVPLYGTCDASCSAKRGASPLSSVRNTTGTDRTCAGGCENAPAFSAQRTRPRTPKAATGGRRLLRVLLARTCALPPIQQDQSSYC